MLAEFVKQISELAVKSAALNKVDLPGDRYALKNGDSVSFHDVPPEHRQHLVERIDDLETAAKSFAINAAAVSAFHNDRSIVLTLDSESRRDRVTMPLKHSPQFKTLLSLGAELQPAQLVRLLRHDLYGVVPDGLLPLVRRVDFKRRNDGSSNIQHGKESLGKSIEAEISGAENIPEYVTMMAPVYDAPDLSQKYPVECSLDINAMAGTFRLCPLPGQLDMAIHAAHAFIHERLTDAIDQATVLYGSP